jgi:glycosyltransferase involved in cell wall biosynthesis
MAAGRPFIYVGPAGGTPTQIAERFGCGWRVEPGDSSGLVDLLERLAAEPELVRAAGEHARAAFLENYDVPQGVARILEIVGVAQTKLKQPAAYLRAAM